MAGAQWGAERSGVRSGRRSGGIALSWRSFFGCPQGVGEGWVRASCQRCGFPGEQPLLPADPCACRGSCKSAGVGRETPPFPTGHPCQATLDDPSAPNLLFLPPRFCKMSDFYQAGGKLWPPTPASRVRPAAGNAVSAVGCAGDAHPRRGGEMRPPVSLPPPRHPTAALPHTRGAAAAWRGGLVGVWGENWGSLRGTGQLRGVGKRCLGAVHLPGQPSLFDPHLFRV